MLGISCEMLEVYEMLCEGKLQMHVYEEKLCLDYKKGCLYVLAWFDRFEIYIYLSILL